MARGPSDRDIDPKRLDTVDAPRRVRRRAKADPSRTLQAEKPKALARARRRPVAPGVMMEPAKSGDGYIPTSPHSDHDLWELQLADAFGSRSHSVMVHFVDQLEALCSSSYDEAAGRWKPDEIMLNAAIAHINSLRPRNEAEAALAAQMVAVHWMTMRMSAQALNGGGMVFEKDAAIAGKLARTYAGQLETMMIVQGKRKPTRQTIIVKKELHQDVHYHDHRGVRENHSQPQGRTARTIDQRAALPGPDEAGNVVSLPSPAREGSLQTARG